MQIGHQFRWLRFRFFGFRCDEEVGSFSFKRFLYSFCLLVVRPGTQLLFTVQTCSSTSPPIFSLAVTKAATSSSINLSKSVIDAGKGSSGMAGAGLGEDLAAGITAAPAAEDVPLGSEDPGSTAPAMSSNREVAASSL